MKYIFFINPDAGQGKSAEKLMFQIHDFALKNKLDYKVIQTRGEGSAEELAMREAKNLTGEKARFFAAGGDGTINDVINGMIGFDNISFGIIPIGTGNDTARSLASLHNKDVLGYEEGFSYGKDEKLEKIFLETLENKEKVKKIEDEDLVDSVSSKEPKEKITYKDFLNIENIVFGKEVEIDLIRYWGVIKDEMVVRYCINMFNIGFDCDVVRCSKKMKEKPFVKGSTAYLLSIVAMFIEKKGISLRIICDGKEIIDGKMLMCYIANGNYNGGGICSSPQGNLIDGKLDVNIVKDIKRREFLKVFPSFKKGKHFYHPLKDKILETIPASKVEIYPCTEKEFSFCVDGEIHNISHLSMEIAKKCIKVILPVKES